MRPGDNEPDPFERRLLEQRMRRPPAAWRDEILAAARGAAPARVVASPQDHWLRRLLWPTPVAWGGLAALWLVTAGLNALGRFESVGSATAAGFSVVPVRAALVEHRRELAALLDEGAAAPEPPPSRTGPPGRRSAVTITNRVA